MSLELSKRALSISPSVTLAIDSRAKALRQDGVDVVGFGVGEPDFDTPEYIRDAAKFAIDAGYTRYTPVAGTLDLREHICEKFLRDNHLKYNPDEVIVSGGAKQSLYIALSVLLNPGDEVLIPAPYWVSYPEMVMIAGGTPVMVPGQEENGFIVTADELRPYITERTKVLILNSPNNPNGCVWSREQLRDIAALAVEKGFYVLSDEIYERLLYDGMEPVSIAEIDDEIKKQTIVVNGVSKTYAMTGWRIGYAAAPRPIIKAMTAFQSHSASNPNSIAQYASSVALTSGATYIKKMLKEFQTRRNLMHALILSIDGLYAHRPQGAFYMMLNLSGILGLSHDGDLISGSEAFASQLLEKKHVAVVPGKAFGDDMHVRLSYATSRERIVEGMRRIEEFVEELE